MGLLGLIAAALGFLVEAPAAVVLGGVSFVACAVYTLRVTAVRADFDRAFGPGWSHRIPEAVKSRLHRAIERLRQVIDVDYPGLKEFLE
jgi:hypothetical protein